MIEESKKIYKEANRLYGSGDYFDSINQYRKAVKIFRVDSLTTELKMWNEEAYELIKDCYMYTASCYTKIGQYGQAINMMDEIISIEPNNFKSLYLRGCANS
jgi:tetratricopeptide (TPR) repeat protein